ncbi:MAG: hypothetical protein A2041_15235 [Bacteroidetes bacterium GWA2_31_9b]|nr:MAG: hypothetical protein A2041_15235 [Bacteroidetes bacterium GWA2_31_9b]
MKKQIKQIKQNIANLLILALMVLVANSLYAQRPIEQNPPRIPDSTQIIKLTNELSRELSLTETQKVEISKIYFDHFEEVKKQIEENKSVKMKNKEEMEILRKKFEEQVKGLLSDDQQEKFVIFQQTHKPAQRKE